jgi:hypothetical protein
MSQLYQTMEEDDSTLLQYLIAEDQPNYELLFDDDEEMAINYGGRHVLTVDFGTPSYKFTINICTYLIF